MILIQKVVAICSQKEQKLLSPKSHQDFSKIFCYTLYKISISLPEASDVLLTVGGVLVSEAVVESLECCKISVTSCAIL